MTENDLENAKLKAERLHPNAPEGDVQDIEINTADGLQIIRLKRSPVIKGLTRYLEWEFLPDAWS